MNITDIDIRHGLNTYADMVHTTPPPIDIFTRATPEAVAPIRRRIRRPVLIGATLATVLVGAGAAAAATGVFSNDTSQFVGSVCGLDIGDARLVASATDSMGNLIEFSVISGATGDASIIASKSPGGTWDYDSTGCGPEPGGAQNPGGQARAGASALTLDGEATLIRIHGWIPQPATTVNVTFSDGTTVPIAAGADGYFLHLVTTAPNANTDIAHIKARAADGTIIYEDDPLGGSRRPAADRVHSPTEGRSRSAPPPSVSGRCRGKSLRGRPGSVRRVGVRSVGSLYGVSGGA